MSLGVDLRFQKLKQGPIDHSLYLLPTDPDVEFSATSPAPCLPVYCLASCHGGSGLNL